MSEDKIKTILQNLMTVRCKKIAKEGTKCYMKQCKGDCAHFVLALKSLQDVLDDNNALKHMGI